MPTSKSSRRWLREHFSDPYVKQAQQSALRSPPVFKLQDLQEGDKLFKPGMTVIDLGAAPGGWSEYVNKIVGKKGLVISLDILPMEPIDDVLFIQGDFNDEDVLQTLCKTVENTKIHWVISDIAPNMTGIESVDQARSMGIAELVVDFALNVVHVENGLLLKVFQGEGFDAFLLEIRKHFKKVVIRKPKASRGRSREIYILAKK